MPRTLGGDRSVQGGLTAKKEQQDSGKKKRQHDDVEPLPVPTSLRSGATLSDPSSVPTLDKFLGPSKPKEPPKKKAKKDQDKKENDKKDDKTKTEKKKKDPPKFSSLQKCHMCRCTPDKREMISCQSIMCVRQWCKQCLVEKYELKVDQLDKKERKEVTGQEGKEEESSSSDEEDAPVVLRGPRQQWKCAVCENICICSNCRRKRNQPSISKKKLTELQKKVAKNFNSFWEYLLWDRDQTKAKKEEQGDRGGEDKSEG